MVLRAAFSSHRSSVCWEGGGLTFIVLTFPGEDPDLRRHETWREEERREDGLVTDEVVVKKKQSSEQKVSRLVKTDGLY